MHSDSSILSFRGVTTELGSRARHFLRTTCEDYTTFELPQEYKRRARAKAKKDSKSKSKSTSSTTKLEQKRKTWNIGTYKWHSLGDYADTIVTFGTTDSYSTQVVSILRAVSTMCQPCFPGRARSSCRQKVLCTNKQEKF